MAADDGTFSTGDLTDGVEKTGTATSPAISTITGWGVNSTPVPANIIFDLGGLFTVEDIVLGTFIQTTSANGAPSNVDVLFSTDNITYSTAANFAYTSSDISGNGHNDLFANVVDTNARYVKLVFDGAKITDVSAAIPPNKWMLDEVTINGVAVPEPSSICLMGLTLLGYMGLRRRKKS